MIDLVTNCLYIFENIYIYVFSYGNFGSILGYVRLSGEWKKHSIRRRLKSIRKSIIESTLCEFSIDALTNDISS